MRTIITLFAALAIMASGTPTKAGYFCGPYCVRKAPAPGGGYRCVKWKQICGRSYP
jgi:hypothetical protein